MGIFLLIFYLPKVMNSVNLINNKLNKFFNKRIFLTLNNNIKISGVITWNNYKDRVFKLSNIRVYKFFDLNFINAKTKLIRYNKIQKINKFKPFWE